MLSLLRQGVRGFIGRLFDTPLTDGGDHGDHDHGEHAHEHCATPEHAHGHADAASGARAGGYALPR
jgi:hypothetical protein